MLSVRGIALVSRVKVPASLLVCGLTQIGWAEREAFTPVGGGLSLTWEADPVESPCGAAAAAAGGSVLCPHVHSDVISSKSGHPVTLAA